MRVYSYVRGRGPRKLISAGRTGATKQRCDRERPQALVFVWLGRGSFNPPARLKCPKNDILVFLLFFRQRNIVVFVFTNNRIIQNYVRRSADHPIDDCYVYVLYETL